jgi:hypothetical protein
MLRGRNPATGWRVDAFLDHRFNLRSKQETRGPFPGPKTEAPLFSMSRLETAMNRLDAAMAKLDAAVARSIQRGDSSRESLEQELDALRHTHEMLQEEARLVSDRLDLAVGRLQNVMAGSL